MHLFISLKRLGQYRKCVQCCYDATGEVPEKLWSYEITKDLGVCMGQKLHYFLLMDVL